MAEVFFTVWLGRRERVVGRARKICRVIHAPVNFYRGQFFARGQTFLTQQVEVFNGLFMASGTQGRRKRSGWSGFGRTNIEGESGRVHIALHVGVAARSIVTQRCTKCKQLQKNAWGTVILDQADVPAVWNLR